MKKSLLVPKIFKGFLEDWLDGEGIKIFVHCAGAQSARLQFYYKVIHSSLPCVKEARQFFENFFTSFVLIYMDTVGQEKRLLTGSKVFIKNGKVPRYCCSL